MRTHKQRLAEYIQNSPHSVPQTHDAAAWSDTDSQSRAATFDYRRGVVDDLVELLERADVFKRPYMGGGMEDVPDAAWKRRMLAEDIYNWWMK